MEDHYRYCLDQLKNTDIYSPILFLSKELRPHASAIYAFANEIEKIPFLVKEPMAGEVRMQWWREVVEGHRIEEALSNPISQALNQTIVAHELPRDGFTRFVEAKLFDLYNDPMPDVETLEAYLGETESFLLQMIAMCAGANANSDLADACGHGGVAIGIAKLLKAVPQHTNLQKIYLPVELLEKHSLSTTHWLAADYSNKHLKAFKEFGNLALSHYSKSAVAISKLSKNIIPVFLPIAMAKSYANKTQSFSKDPRNSFLILSPITMQIQLIKSALFGLPSR